MGFNVSHVDSGRWRGVHGDGDCEGQNIKIPELKIDPLSIKSMTTFQPPPQSVGSARDKSWTDAMQHVDFQQAMEKQAANRKKLWSMATSPTGLAVFTGVLVMMLLWIFNPPMVQQSGKSSIEKQKPSTLKIVIWGLLAAAIVFFSPMVWKLANQ